MVASIDIKTMSEEEEDEDDDDDDDYDDDDDDDDDDGYLTMHNINHTQPTCVL